MVTKKDLSRVPFSSFVEGCVQLGEYSLPYVDMFNKK